MTRGRDYLNSGALTEALAQTILILHLILSAYTSIFTSGSGCFHIYVYVCVHMSTCVLELLTLNIGQGHNIKTSWLHKCSTPRKVEVIFDSHCSWFSLQPAAHSGSSTSSIYLGCIHFSLFPLLQYQPSLSIVYSRHPHSIPVLCNAPSTQQ